MTHDGCEMEASTTRAKSGPIDLPAYRHLPGRNARPGSGGMMALADMARHADADDALLSQAKRCGLYLARHGFYWEAHEVLEPVWLRQAANSAERLELQGIIQLANACLKAELGRDRAALRLAAIAADLFGEALVRGGERLPLAAPGRHGATALALALASGTDWRPGAEAAWIQFMKYNAS